MPNALRNGASGCGRRSLGGEDATDVFDPIACLEDSRLAGVFAWEVPAILVYIDIHLTGDFRGDMLLSFLGGGPYA